MIRHTVDCTCAHCGKAFRRGASQVGGKTYCSVPCAQAGMRLPPDEALERKRACKAAYQRRKRDERIAELGREEYNRQETARKARYEQRRASA